MLKNDASVSEVFSYVQILTSLLWNKATKCANSKVLDWKKKMSEMILKGKSYEEPGRKLAERLTNTFVHLGTF